MIKVRFIGAPEQEDMPADDTQVNQSYGYTFPRGVWVEVTGEAAIRLPKNSHFEVEQVEEADFVEVSSVSEALQIDEPEKPKRKRRTKAEMEAARTAE